MIQEKTFFGLLGQWKSMMYISPTLFILLLGAGLLLVGKLWAKCCYFRDLRIGTVRTGWHYDPWREFPDGR